MLAHTREIDNDINLVFVKKLLVANARELQDLGVIDSTCLLYTSPSPRD